MSTLLHTFCSIRENKRGNSSCNSSAYPVIRMLFDPVGTGLLAEEHVFNRIEAINTTIITSIVWNNTYTINNCRKSMCIQQIITVVPTLGRLVSREDALLFLI